MLYCESARRLIWVPIIHTEVELGSLADSYKDLCIKKIGKAGWNDYLKSVEDMWKSIRSELGCMKLDYENVRLYQDALPTCGEEEQIVKELAAGGSPNHTLLLEIMGKGAKLTGTESPEILTEEYELIRTVVKSRNSESGQRLTESYRKRSGEILKRRDCYIAERIDETLGLDETGLIFLGLLHSLDLVLPPSVHMTVLGCTDSTTRGEK